MRSNWLEYLFHVDFRFQSVTQSYCTVSEDLGERTSCMCASGFDVINGTIFES